MNTAGVVSSNDVGGGAFLGGLAFSYFLLQIFFVGKIENSMCHSLFIGNIKQSIAYSVSS
jgi:hypothetical protein